MKLIFLLALPVWVAAGLYLMATGSTKKLKILGMLSVSAAIILGLVFSGSLQTGGVTDIAKSERQGGEPAVQVAPSHQKARE